MRRLPYGVAIPLDAELDRPTCTKESALAIHEKLIELRDMCDESFEAMQRTIAKLNQREYLPGQSYTAYNFDKSVKVVRKTQMSTIYDEVTLNQAKSLFAEYIREEEPSEAIVFMIKAALENKKGNFDKNKVGLLVENPHDIKN